MRTIGLTVALLMVCHSIAMAQRDYTLYFATQTIEASRLTQPEEITGSQLDLHTFAGFRYLVVQFADIPSATERASLERLGVEFLSYLPNYAYLLRTPAGLDLRRLEAQAFLLPEPAHKFSAPLAAEDFSYTGRDEDVRVVVYPHPGISPAQLAEELAKQGAAIIQTGASFLTVVVAPGQLTALAAHPAVGLLDLPEPPPVPEGLRGRTLGRVNLLGQGPQQGLDGQGVNMAIADDGLPSHIDFQGRITDWTSNDAGDHADMTGGLAAGAGNLDPRGMGMAPGAHLYFYNILGYPHIQQAPANYQDHGIVITSTSYGEICGGWYTATARNIDAQVVANPPLLHVFSAGNSAGEVCGLYGGITGPGGEHYGNITGGRKAAKHSMAVANLHYNDSLHQTSSRGPAIDGRIKPDISAHGQGSLSTGPDNTYSYGSGTSAAAPTLAGTAALLYQASRTRNNGQDPPSALIKAALLNGAEDLGRPGPDYDYGWGRVHAGRALEVVLQNQYQTGSVGHSDLNQHLLDVPAGVRAIRLMVYWTDPAGSPTAAKALVNDLDLTLQTPDNEIVHPWVLSAYPHIDSLTRPAWRGVDRRNNMEQVTLTDPVAGIYVVRIKGALVPEGPQSYFIVYNFIRDDLTLTYPSGGEGLQPGETETVRWDATGHDGTFQLSYSADSAQTWTTIASQIDGHRRHFDWTVPDLGGQHLFFRLQRNGLTTTTDSAAVILDLPTFDFSQTGDTTALIYWSPVPGAAAYDIYRLGDRYMEVIGSTSDTHFPFTITPWEEGWFSVRARTGDGGGGRRAVAQKYRHLPCEAQITITFNFDQYPGENHWEIRSLSGEVLAGGGPYAGATAHSTLEIQQCLPAGCFGFYIYDRYNDGMCCDNGNGSFQITDANDNVLLSGGAFTDVDIQYFCVAPGLPTLALQVTQTNPISCFGNADGAALATAGGGNGNYSYSWSNGQTGPAATGLAAGLHSVTVADGEASVSKTIVVSQPPPLQLSLTPHPPACQDHEGGVISSSVTGGVPPFQYLWTNGATTPSLSNTAPGLYALTLTDANGCTTTQSATLQAPEPVQVSLSQTNVSCAGGADGFADAQAGGGSGNYDFQWSHGHTGPNAQNLSAGTYQLTVSDDHGCQAITDIVITEPIALTLTLADGDSPGAIELEAAGGTPPYFYLWSDGGTAEDPSGLAPGSYQVTVTDANLCSATAQWTIDSLAEPTYCTSTGANTNYEWIEQVSLNGNSHTSGNDNGYGDHTAVTFELIAGDTIALECLPGTSGVLFPEHWRAWIDLNQDGDFADDGELILAAGPVSGPVAHNWLLPADALPGSTRLRISMQYGSPPPSCGNLGYGEVEDYRLTILPPPGDDGSGTPPDPDPGPDYCASGGQNTVFEWIEGIKLGDLDNPSGNNGGYADFTNLTAEGVAGQLLTFQLTPGYQSNYFGETWRIWIDYNRDGDFDDDGEMVFSSTQSNTVINDGITLPPDLAPGPTRLRVTMKWGALASPCESYNWGETEDYTLVILSGSQTNHSPSLFATSAVPVGEQKAVLFPNPTRGAAFLRWDAPQEEPYRILITDKQGRRVWEEVFPAPAGHNEWVLPSQSLPPGVYFVQLAGTTGRQALRLIVY